MALNNAINLAFPVSVAQGGTGLNTIPANRVLLGNGTSAVSSASALTDGQLLIGSTGSVPVAATLSAGAGISITPASGSITIAATGGGSGFAWTGQTSNVTAANNSGYICTGSTPIVITLPTTSSAVGDSFRVVNYTSQDAGWSITKGSSQKIRFGTSLSTSATTGALAASAIGDTAYIVCTVAGTTASEWVVVTATGNLTIGA